MDTSEAQETSIDTAAAPTPAEPKAPTALPLGESARRSLERAAVRDLQARKRADYQQENQADNALIDELRHKRNEQIERIDREIHELRAAYGVSESERWVPWIDAHDEAVVAKRAARKALAEIRKRENPSDRAALEKLRVAHRKAQDAFAEEQQELTRTRELAVSDLREDLNEARGRKGEAKRTMKADLKEIRTANAAEKGSRTAAETHARQERKAASEARWDAARKANLQYAAAIVELRDAERSKEPRSRIEELRTKKDLLRAQAEELVDREIHELSAAYGVSESERWVRWIDAHDEAVVAKRAARKALAEIRKRENPSDRAALEKLRVAHRKAQDAFAEEQQELTRTRELAVSDLREDLNEARGRKGEAKRTMKADLKEIRTANAAEKGSRTAAETHARQERKAASEARWDAARKANLQYAAAIVELRDAERSKEPRNRIEELRTKKDLLRAQAEELETIARHADLKVSDELFRQQWSSAAEDAYAKAQAKDAWLGGKHDTAVEKRKARIAIRAFKSETNGAKTAAESDLRHRRNAEGEAYSEAVTAVYTARGQREAELRDEYLGKQDNARKARKEAKAAARAYAREAKAAYHEALEALRKERVRVEEEFTQAVNEIHRTRGVERAEERAQVRDIADEILTTYEQSERPGTPRV